MWCTNFKINLNPCNSKTQSHVVVYIRAHTCISVEKQWSNTRRLDTLHVNTDHRSRPYRVTHYVNQ